MPRDQRLFGPDGPLEDRYVDDGVGGRKKVRGAQCRLCRDFPSAPGADSTSKTDLLAYLGHLSGEVGDPGGGWTRCPRASQLPLSTRTPWRATFLELAAAKRARAAPRGSSSSVSVSSLDSEGTGPRPVPPPPPGDPLPQLGPGFDAPSPTPRSGKPELTPEIRRKFTMQMCMACFEGNIAPFAIARNMSMLLMLGLLTSSWDDKGVPLRLPTREYILGAGLVMCYEAVKGAVQSTFGGDTVRWTLATDGGDTVMTRVRRIGLRFEGRGRFLDVAVERRLAQRIDEANRSSKDELRRLRFDRDTTVRRFVRSTFVPRRSARTRSSTSTTSA